MENRVKTPGRLSVLILFLLLSGCAKGFLNGTIVGDIGNSASGFFNSSAGNDWVQLTFRGGIYSHTVEPLTINRDPTDVRKSMKEGIGRINQYEYPVTAGLSIRLGKNGLGDVAKEHGIETIYYADLEKWSVLFGIWSMEKVHIYGR